MKRDTAPDGQQCMLREVERQVSDAHPHMSSSPHLFQRDIEYRFEL